MKIYRDQVYLVIETDKFDLIENHLIEPYRIDTKFLLGNKKEVDYISKILGIEPEYLDTDYFRIHPLKGEKL